MTENIKSPLTFSGNVTKVRTIKSDEIIDIYSNYFKMDVRPYFEGIPEVQVYKCMDTGYMFYYPFSTEGDEKYYSKMGEFAWYYNPSRWEHGKALEMINENEHVLEVGAGQGDFLLRVKTKSPNVQGLELNGSAIERAKAIGIHLRKELIQTHAKNHKNTYDVVCSFQVLEHISQPYDFLEAKTSSLKKGGRLIIGVPNNDSYISSNVMANRVLNMPPHHMGLWTYESLKSLEKLFNITLLDVHYEPLVGGNVDVYLWNRVSRFFFSVSIFPRIIWKLKLHGILRYFLLKKADKIRGSSMLAVFQKN